MSSASADLLDDGRAAFFDYDFELASELYAKFAEQLKKKPSEDGERYLKRYMRELDIAENALDNVQKIEIIDRVDVPVGDFYNAIVLPSSGGKFIPQNQLPESFPENESDFVFSSEDGDFIMWTEMDNDGRTHILESDLLLDGSWEKPRRSGEILNGGGNVRNPFMLTDGVTLYFAADGEASMGGYDLFIASRDASTGEFLQPTPLGFPFNSPYNEYVIAIDEENGIGWWVTDRNDLDGQLSIYIFKTDEVRKNYDRDEIDDIVDYARLNDISAVKSTDMDFDNLMQLLKESSLSKSNDSDDEFQLTLPDGRVLTRSKQIPSSSRRDLSIYLHAEKEYSKHKDELENLRRRYAAGRNGKGSSPDLESSIKELEKKLDDEAQTIKIYRNKVISSLQIK